MTNQEFEELKEIYRCKDCHYWNNDYDCGHTDGHSEICGDFYIDKNEGFTIKCNKCGRESVYTNPMVGTKGGIILYIDWHYEEGDFHCDCGNIVKL